MSRKLAWSLRDAFILLLAAYLRIVDVTHGYDNACLLPPEELWLYDYPQPSSWYAWNTSPVIYGEESPHIAYTRTTLVADSDLLNARFGGALLGVLTVALTLAYTRRLRHPAGWLAALFVAVSPWFVIADRWVIRFDFATLIVAAAVLSLCILLQKQDNAPPWLPAIFVGATMLLLLVPPLWWLVPPLLGLVDGNKTRNAVWRWALFFGLCELLLLPALQSPIHWLNAALNPDIGTTAALIWCGLALALWHWRNISWQGIALGVMVTLLCGFYTGYRLTQIPYLTTVDWELVAYLQQRVPDGAVVQFDAETWHITDVVRCPAQEDIKFTARPQPIFRPYIPGVRIQPPDPTYIVTTQPEALKAAPYTTTIGDVTVARLLALPNPTEVSFGELVRLLGYEIRTLQVETGQTLDIRVDIQFGAHLDESILAHAMFIHVTLPGQPGDKIANFSMPFEEMVSMLGSRQQILNTHLRAIIPVNTPPGTYDVLFGVFDVYTGTPVASADGNTLMLGKIEVIEK